MKKRKFELFAGYHEENEVVWNEQTQEWDAVVDSKGKPTFRRYVASGNMMQPTIVESHLDLVKLFKNKFREVLPEPVAPTFQQGPPQPMSSDGRPAVFSRTSVESPNAAKPAEALGQDVTSQFNKVATEVGLQIFAQKNGQFVIREADGSLYDGGKKLNKKQVEELLAGLVTA